MGERTVERNVDLLILEVHEHEFSVSSIKTTYRRDFALGKSAVYAVELELVVDILLLEFYVSRTVDC